MRNVLAATALFFASSFPAFVAASAPNGITLPEGYNDWRLLSVHQRTALPRN
jgi:hypothetical protein